MPTPVLGRRCGVSIGSLVRRPEAGSFVGLIVVYAFFAIKGEAVFIGAPGWSSWLNIAAEVGIVALPVGLLMISGELDISIGAMIPAGSMTVAIVSGHYGLPITLGIACALGPGLGLLVGLINGLLTVRTTVLSLIITLGDQWQEKLIPFWTEVAALARDCGVERIALELHGNQCVFNVPSLLKLRQTIGPVIGANLDPSHLFWMGADALAAAGALGDAVYQVHAKDTFLNAPVQATTSLLENGSLMDIPARSWSCITLGFGHGEAWWRHFCYRLKMAGYDGWLSIEHEDVLLNALEGLEKSVALLKGVVPRAAADVKLQDI